MNLLHRWYCSSDRWAGILQGRLMPWVLDGVDLRDSALEIGPGPGLSTDWLRPRVPRLTTIEVDERLAQSLKRRMDGTNVTVVKGDATSMPFPDGSFSGAVCCNRAAASPAPTASPTSSGTSPTYSTLACR